MSDRNLLKQILETTRDIWDRPGTRPAVRKNFAAVIACGTPTLGCEVYASAAEELRCYHRCKSRFCPSCGYRATLNWLAQVEADLPDIAYSGIVFTMPSELWGVFRKNRHLMHDLPALGASVIQEWAKVKYDADVLIMVVPHTFGGDLKFNSHLHMLVSAAGFVGSEGRFRHLEFDKYALMVAWRLAVLGHLRRARASSVINSDLSTLAFEASLASAYQNQRHRNWVIFIDRITSKSHFLRYAARYVRRPPIASWRILQVTKTHVDFVAKDTRAKCLVRTRLLLGNFIRLLAPHVPDHYRNSIRYFGLLAPRSKNLIWRALFLRLGQTRKPRPKRIPWRESLIKCFGFDPLRDRKGEEMRWVGREHGTV